MRLISKTASTLVLLLVLPLFVAYIMAVAGMTAAMRMVIDMLDVWVD